MNFRTNLQITFTCVALLWIVYFAGLFLPFNLLNYGIRPRSVDGLPGLIIAPFLHAGIKHLASNSVALAALLFFSLMYSRKLTFKAIIIIALAGGGGTWLLGAPDTIHVGASGIIFGLLGYLLAIGFFRRELLALLVSVAIACYYGWAVFSVFIILPGVSWSGHFFGFASGIVAAWMTRYEKVS